MNWKYEAIEKLKEYSAKRQSLKSIPEEMARLEPSVKEYEPALALDGGKDGLAFYRAVVENFTHLLADGGYLCFEFGLGQHMAVSMILQEYGYTDIVLRKDLRGVVRAVRGKKK
mgnify:CR=1 FL=1